MTALPFRARVKQSSVLSPAALVVLPLIVGITVGATYAAMERNILGALLCLVVLGATMLFLRESDTDRARLILPSVDEQANQITEKMLRFDHEYVPSSDPDAEHFFAQYTDAMSAYSRASQRPTVNALNEVREAFAEADRLVESLFERVPKRTDPLLT